MFFEDLVDRLVSLFDVGQARAVAVANERLGRMVTDSGALQSIISLGTTTNGTASYTLASNVARVLKVTIPFTSGTLNYEGVATAEEFWDVAAGVGQFDGNVYAVLPDSDSDMNTMSLQLYPTPGESGKTISGLVALRPSTLTYTSNTTLPIPVDSHPALLAGCEAVLFDEEDRQDEAQKKETEFAAGVQSLSAAANRRAKGSGRHRMRMVGYDLSHG